MLPAMTAIETRDVKRVRKAVEAQGARNRNDVPAVNEAAPEAALRRAELIEMNLCRVLIKPRGQLVLGFFHGHAIDVIDPFADLVVHPTIEASRLGERVSCNIDAWTRGSKCLRRDNLD